MNHTAFTERREELLQSIERDQGEVRVAVQDLAGAARFKLDLGERIKASPLTWVVGAVLVGVWLGTRAAPVAASGQRRSR